MVSFEHQHKQVEAHQHSSPSYKDKKNVSYKLNDEQNDFSHLQPSVGKIVDNINDNAHQFVTCHHYVGNSGKSSSPAHWHKEIEIMHFTHGKGFTHICQCQSDTFDAPAIVVVPSNLIHRTCYPPHCKVNRTLFSGDCIRLHENDNALEQCINFLSGGSNKGSVVLKSGDAGFEKAETLLNMLENLSDNPNQHTFDPASAQEDSIEQDKVDAFVAATFANIGTEQDRLAQLNALAHRHEQSDNSATRLNAINAGSIAIASAQNYTSQESNRNTIRPVVEKRPEIIEQFDCRKAGLSLQFKGFLVNILGVLYENGYLSDNGSPRRQRLARSNDIKIKELLKYIHDNYNRQMNISDLAERLEVTNQYFCRFFKQLTDMSFIDYLNDLRLQKAAIEIASTQQSIREISGRHGFDTIGYFFKLFREHYQTTPMGYRSKFLDNPANLKEENYDLEEIKCNTSKGKTKNNK